LRIVPAFDREIRHLKPRYFRCDGAPPRPGLSSERSNDSHNRGTPPGLAVASPGARDRARRRIRAPRNPSEWATRPRTREERSC
jgi:hypothetical protein